MEGDGDGDGDGDGAPGPSDVIGFSAFGGPAPRCRLPNLLSPMRESGMVLACRPAMRAAVTTWHMHAAAHETGKHARLPTLTCCVNVLHHGKTRQHRALSRGGQDDRRTVQANGKQGQSAVDILIALRRPCPDLPPDHSRSLTSPRARQRHLAHPRQH